MHRSQLSPVILVVHGVSTILGIVNQDPLPASGPWKGWQNLLHAVSALLSVLLGARMLWYLHDISLIPDRNTRPGLNLEFKWQYFISPVCSTLWWLSRLLPEGVWSPRRLQSLGNYALDWSTCFLENLWQIFLVWKPHILESTFFRSLNTAFVSISPRSRSTQLSKEKS